MKQCRLTGILRIEIRIATILRLVRRFSPNGMPQDYLWLSVGSVGIFDFPELNGAILLGGANGGQGAANSVNAFLTTVSGFLSLS
mgnify:CR=1 FL=1